MIFYLQANKQKSNKKLFHPETKAMYWSGQDDKWETRERASTRITIKKKKAKQRKWILNANKLAEQDLFAIFLKKEILEMF